MTLFWKILLGFWLSLLLMAGGAIGLARIYEEAHLATPDRLAEGKWVNFHLDHAARRLRSEGLDGLRSELQSVNSAKAHPLDKGAAPTPGTSPRQPPEGNAPPSASHPGDMSTPPGEHPANTSHALPPPDNERDDRPPSIIPLLVNDRGEDLLGRAVPRAAWFRAKQVLEEEALQGDEPQMHRPVRHIQLADGTQVTLFLINRMMPRPPNAGINIMFSLFDVPVLVPLSAFVASLIFSILLARYLVHPIRLLRDGLRSVAHGRFDLNVSEQMGHRRDELGQLGNEADRMGRQVGQLMESQKRLLHDISHDLRSPLARVQVAIDLVRQQPERYEEMLGRLEHETRRLDRLIGEVLTLARLESGVPLPQNDFIDLAELLSSLVDDACFEAPDRRITFDNQVNEECLLSCRGELLHRAFENLVRNAMQHTPENAEVEVGLKLADGHYLITIRDHGPGIRPELLSQVFEPFHHAENTRGHGLGLAIARRALEAHQGTLQAENHPQGGLLLTAALPAKASPLVGA